MPPVGILIAEDKASAAQELREKLERLGYAVLGIASSGKEAVAKTEELHPEVILMNIRLKGAKDGIHTGSLIHNRHETPIVYVIDTTSQATVRRAGATGPYGYVFRPYDEHRLFAVVETALMRHQLEQKLQQSMQWLNTVLTSIGDGVIATDEQGLLRFINPVAAQLTGHAEADAIGKSLLEIFPLVDEKSGEMLDLSSVQSSLPGAASKEGFAGLLLKRDGLSVPIEASVTAIKDPKRNVHGMVVVFRDVTQQRDAIQEIRRQANRAEALTQVASQLNAKLDLATVLQTICTVTNRTIRSAGTAVFLRDIKEDTFHTPQDIFRNMAAVSQNRDWKTYKGVQFELPGEVFQNLLSRQAPVVVISDLAAHPNIPYFSVYKDLGIQTFAIAALFRGNDIIGALIPVFTEDHKLLPEDEIALLRGLADQASSAIENASLFEQVLSGRERQRKLAKILVDVQEAERRYIATELHDHFGQLLTGLQFMLESTKSQATGTQKSSLEEIQSAVGGLIGQVREMSLNLRPSMLDDLGLIPTLYWHFDRYTVQTGIRVTLKSDNVPERFPTEIETAAYRIIQEALTNVARHSQVKDVFVGLVVHGDTLWVEVLDKGKGFDAKSVLDRPTSGLGGMRERASLLGGYLYVNSFIDQGTQVLAALPLTDKPLERRKYDRKRHAG